MSKAHDGIAQGVCPWHHYATDDSDISV